VYKFSREFIFANLVLRIFPGFIFAKQTRYGIKQKSYGPKMNENFMRKKTFAN